MPHRAPSPDADPRWTPAQRRLWAGHRERLPNPEAAKSLMGRWLDTAAAPASESSFLHLLYLAGTSEALFLALLRHPGQLDGLSRQVGAEDGLGPEGMDEALARFFLLGRMPSAASVLAAFRALQTARILLQDVLGILSFQSVTRELSSLADVLIQHSLALTYQPLRESLGLPMAMTPEGRPAPCGMVLFALGKLGARELNYASDVDLIAIYGAEGTTDQGHPNGSFFNAWVQAAVSLLTTMTPDGPCLRVDMNLRPRGRDGELTLSADAALAYYREWADLWERQAWIKARPCAGDLELGARFLRQMEPVTYQPYSWAGIAKQVRRMRQMAEAKLGAGSEADVKEGPGGIRDAEFAIQALQLARGPVDRWVREPHTLLALSKLAQKGVVSTARQAAFARHYTVLRKAEHWAQVQQMRQVHRIPSGTNAWAALSRFLRLPGGVDARAAVSEARGELRHLFLRTLDEMESRDAEQDGVASMLTPEGMLSSLRHGRFQDPVRALPLLSAIYGTLTPHLTVPHRRENLVRIHYSLQGEFARSNDPYKGLAALHKLAQALAGEPGALPALLDRPRLPRMLFRLASQSETLTEALLCMPALVGLLGFDAMRDLQDRLDRVPRLEEGPDALRRWQKEVMVLAQAREIVLGELVGWSQGIHSLLAERVCAAAFAAACASVEAREGLGPGILARSVGLLALGRLGLREMHPRSDLDLVFVKRGPWILPEDPDRSARVEADLLREMAGSLAAVTRHGTLYETDFRLRPYGASGLPIQSHQGLLDYFSGPAQLWERLSYLKARAVAGNAEVGREALEPVRAMVLSRGAGPQEVEDLMDLRRRLETAAPDFEGALKFKPGGLLHQDLLLYALQVQAGHLCAGTGFLDMLAHLEGDGLLSPEERGILYRARSFMEGFLHRSRLRFARSPARGWPKKLLADLDALWLPRPSGLSKAADGETLERHWREHREAVVGIWERRVGGREEVKS